MLQKITYVIENIVKCIAIFPLLLITILMIRYQNNVVMNISEKSMISINNITIIIPVLLLTIGLFGVLRAVRTVNAWWVFGIPAVIYFLVGMFLIWKIDMTQYNDSGLCYTYATGFLQGDYSGFQKGEYVYEYPHQLGLILYDSFLILLCDKISFVYCVNLLWVIAGTFILWRGVLEESQNHREGKITILLAFGFVPQFLFLFFAYGLVPGLGCLLFALYFWGRYFQKEEKGCLVLGLLFLGAACLIRMNYVIAGIALLIIGLLQGIKRKKKAVFVACILLLLIMILPKVLVTKGVERITGADLSQGMPATLHIAMGLQNNKERAAGWYNGFNHTVYMETGCDVERSREIGLETIEERLSYFVYHPGKGLEFFGEKVITTWCEPTFQSVWSGPMMGVNGKTKVPQLQEFYSGGASFKAFSFIMNGFNILIFVFSAFYTVWNLLLEKQSMGLLKLFGILFFLGGFLFHLFWETKSQYVYPYVVCLLPVAAGGVQVILERCFSKSPLKDLG